MHAAAPAASPLGYRRNGFGRMRPRGRAAAGLCGLPASEREHAVRQLDLAIDREGEVGLAVAVGVALDDRVALLEVVAQLAFFLVEFGGADQIEVLVLLLVVIGVDGDNLPVRCPGRDSPIAGIMGICRIFESNRRPIRRR